MKKTIAFFAMVATSVNFSIAQKFEKQQPDILYAVDKDHNPDSIKIGIRTTNPQSPLDVRGEITADSMRIKAHYIFS